MINFYSPVEISKISASCAILAEVNHLLAKAIEPGMSTSAISELAEELILARNAKPAFKGYGGFPHTACVSVNEELIHGIPSSKKILRPGDLVKVDLGVIFDGFYSDSAFSKSLAEGNVENDTLITAAIGAFNAGINAIKPGAYLGDVEAAIGTFIAKAGYFTPSAYCGHGIGHALHEEPRVHNFGTPKTGVRLANGMVLAIEPMLTQGDAKTTVAADGWTVRAQNKRKTAHYEHTIVIENGHARVLTRSV